LGFKLTHFSGRKGSNGSGERKELETNLRACQNAHQRCRKSFLAVAKTTAKFGQTAFSSLMHLNST
jgi:hypothetical protein